MSCKTQMANFGHSATFRIAKCQGNLVHPLAQTFGNMWKVKLCIATRISRLEMPKRKRAPQFKKWHTPKPMAHLQAGLLEVSDQSSLEITMKQHLVVPVHICSSCFVQDRLSPSESDSTSMSVFTNIAPSKLMHHST